MDKVDFSKPDKYLREITDFLNSVTLVTDLQLKQRSKSISSRDAQLLLQHLLQLVVPNVKEMPKFTHKDVLHLFQTLGYPYSIRSDAITAVGAPNSIAYLVRALYWLYLNVRTYYRHAFPGAIIEESDEENKEESNSD